MKYPHHGRIYKVINEKNFLYDRSVRITGLGNRKYTLFGPRWYFIICVDTGRKYSAYLDELEETDDWWVFKY